MASGQGVEHGKLFVGGISWETTEESLATYFSKFGTVTVSNIMTDPITKKPRGFGFVTYSDPASVAVALSNGPHQLDGKTIDPKPATTKQPGGTVSQLRTKKVFIGGLPSSATPEEVTAFFTSKYGDDTVREVDLKTDKTTQRMRGFGFVTFDSEDLVEQICAQRWFDIEGKKVEAKKADPKSVSGQRMAGGYPGAQAGYDYNSQWGRGGGAQAYAGYGYGYNTGNPGSYGYGGAAQGTGYGASAGSYDQYGQSANGQQPMTNYQDSYSGYSTSRTDATGYPAQQYPPYQQQQQQPQQPQQQQQQPYGGAQAGGHSGYGGRAGQHQSSYGYGMRSGQ